MVLIKVGSSNFPNSKGGYSVKMEIDRRSPSKVTPKSVTNNPKATPKSVTKVSPKSVTNDPTVCPKPDKNINTPPLPSPAQNPPPVVCEATSKITPRRSPRLTPSKRKMDAESLLQMSWYICMNINEEQRNSML